MTLCDGQKLIAVSTAIAFQLSEKLSTDDLAILGELLSAVGDQLAVLAAVKATAETNTSCCCPPKKENA